MKDTLFSSNLSFNSKGILREFSKPVVMGILNATPDSFYGASRVINGKKALDSAAQMINEGASILDIGGYSSRPGAKDVSEKEEIARTKTLISEIKNQFPDILISIDTFRSRVASEAVLAGADLINDISGGQIDPLIFDVASMHQCPFIMMHMRGTPQEMMLDTHYENVLNALFLYFSKQIGLARKAGIKDIIIDPGFGFSKTGDQNFALLRKMNLLKLFELPILAGISRKSMIYNTLETDAENSLNGTTALHSFALLNGAQILRVHDVKAAVETIQLIDKLNQS